MKEKKRKRASEDTEGSGRVGRKGSAASAGGASAALSADYTFEELFDLDEIQKIQDAFADATGVASIITHTDGSPITNPSNFCRLCRDIIRKTEKGLCNCYRSDAVIGRYNPDGPIVRPCLSGGLWDGGASISVGGRHIANWLIGQVRNDAQNTERLLDYAREIGADEQEFAAALKDVTVMSTEQFRQVCNALFLIANMMSQIAYQNAELRHLRNYLGNIVNSMPSVLVGVDSDGLVTEWNREAERDTSVRAVDALGRPLTAVFPRLASAMVHVKEAMAQGEVRTEAATPRREGGETRYEEVTVFPLVANGVKGAVIRVDDVTERVRLQEMMLQSEKMLSVGGLAAGMAHEINNPLAGIMQTASVLKSRLMELDLAANRHAAEKAGVSMGAVRDFMETRGVGRMLDRICESGERAAGVVSNMLSFARKGDGSAVPEQLAELLDRSVELAHNDYDLKKKRDFRRIEIVREYETPVPPVMCEGPQIQQVILNILRNGAEAMYDAAEARSDYQPRFVLRLSHEREAGMVRVEIEDNGPGMDEGTRKRAFEPFFTTKPPDRGTGLGLSVSYFIVTEIHGGQMSAESSEGQGAIFVIRLPVAQVGFSVS